MISQITSSDSNQVLKFNLTKGEGDYSKNGKTVVLDSLLVAKKPRISLRNEATFTVAASGLLFSLSLFMAIVA